jgi:O-antigen/teichoic acid export membrane protein
MIIISAVNVLLNYLFISLFGTIGAAIASLVAQILFFILIYYYAQKHYPLHYEITKVLKMTGVSVVLTIIAYNINSVILIPRIFIKGSLILSFPFLLYFLGVYEQIELKRIKETWSKWKNPKNLIKNLKNIKMK